MKKIFKLDGLDCANCANKMERDIQKIEGVAAATINFMTTKLTIEAGRDDMGIIVEEAKKIVKKYEPQVEIVKA